VRSVRELRLGTVSPSALLEVAARTGALDGAGLRIVEVPASSSREQFAALLDGDLDAIVTNPDNVVAYRCVPDNPLGRLGDVRILAALDRGLGLSLCAAPGITELDGATLGVDVPGSGLAFVGYELLQRLGIRYAVTALGSTPRRATALLTGGCAMTVLNAGNELRAEHQGARRIASVADIGPYIGAVLATTGDSLHRNGFDLRSLVGVLLRTARDVVAGRRPELLLSAVQDRLAFDEYLARRHIAVLVSRGTGLTPNGRFRDAELKTVLALRNRHTKAELDARSVLRHGLIDTSLLPAQ
jgi:ABC-type nitrate/sulfonate/bicarbonate transport system substrate-binding protein